jgi:hypothetical protein
MDNQFVRVLCDIHCEWEGLPPVYRVYVNDELFTERTWIWNDVYLEELLQISAPPGQYQIRHELVPPHLAQLTVENIRIEHGHARILDNNILGILK